VQIEKTPVLPGLDAAQAALAGLSPAFRTNTIALSNGQAQFQVTLSRVQQFVVEGSTDLATWSPVLTNSAVIGGSVSLRDPDAAAYTNRFYRAFSVP